DYFCCSYTDTYTFVF
nr:immunoglobulin light chain junction region [Macaca mulatta]